MLHAYAAVLASGAPQAHIGSDCSSALLACNGQCTCPPELCALVDGSISLASLAAAQGLQVTCHKVKSHEGCGFNKAADSIARALARHGRDFGLAASHDHLIEAVFDGTIGWLWVACTHQAQAVQYPHLGRDGCWTHAAATCQPATQPDRMGLAVHETAPATYQVCLRLVQYNCLSLKGDVALKLMQRGLDKQRAGVAGLQETRLPHSGITLHGNFWVVSAPCTPAGVGGCQIWLSTQRRVCAIGPQSFGWDRKSIALLHSAPQLLAITVHSGPLRFAVVSGHAPPSHSPDAAKEAWWDELHRVMMKIPGTHSPLLLLDANARFSIHPDLTATAQAVPEGINAQRLLRTSSDFHLWVSAQKTRDGVSLVSWTSPNGKDALLDYFLCPAE